MTKILFYQNAYLKEHQTKVVKIDKKNVFLEETIFFPQTSTEPGDIGTINDCKIIGLKKDGDDIWHILNREPIFKEDEIVNLQLDWGKRYKAMKLHSALHLLAGVFDAQFKERAVAGAVKLDSSYLVFKHELSDEVIRESLSQANKNIQEELEIKTYEDEKRKGFRWCKVGNYDSIPCGGVHVKNTKEIKEISLKEKITEDGKQKIVIEIK